MSGKLISEKEHVHNFNDDLESTIYILLWVALMYSKCSNSPMAAGFLEIVLDTQPHSTSTYASKPDFLMGRQFLRDVKFVDRPCLDNLLDQLTKLFAVRYHCQPEEDARKAENAWGQLLKENPGLQSIYDALPIVQYDRRIKILKDHEETINYFEEALKDRSLWPPNDGADE